MKLTNSTRAAAVLGALALSLCGVAAPAWRPPRRRRHRSRSSPLTRFLNASGGIDHVVNQTGAAVTADSPGPSDVVSYP